MLAIHKSKVVINEEPSEGEQRLRLFAPVTNRSRASRIVRLLLPLGHAVERGGVCQVVEQHLDGTRIVMGSGPTWAEALAAATANLEPKVLYEKLGSELRAVHSLDIRQMYQRERR